jgi:hypothetical protein
LFCFKFLKLLKALLGSRFKTKKTTKAKQKSFTLQSGLGQIAKKEILTTN